MKKCVPGVKRQIPKGSRGEGSRRAKVPLDPTNPTRQGEAPMGEESLMAIALASSINQSDADPMGREDSGRAKALKESINSPADAVVDRSFEIRRESRDSSSHGCASCSMEEGSSRANALKNQRNLSK